MQEIIRFLCSSGVWGTELGRLLGGMYFFEILGGDVVLMAMGRYLTDVRLGT